MSGERDLYGAIIQPPSSGGAMPYGWFIWERGFKGITSALRLPLTPRSVRLGTTAPPHAKRRVAGSQAQGLPRDALPARVTV